MRSPKFNEPRRNLRRSDQGGGRDRRRRAGAGDFEEAGQMRRHGTGDKPGRRKHESENNHCAARCRQTLRCHFRSPRRRRCPRDQQPVQRQPDHNMQRGPNEACTAPTKLRVEKGRQRPSDRARKTRDQSNSGDRSARGAAVEPGQRGESRIIKAHRHANAERSPGESESDKSRRETEQDEPRRENQIGKREHAATATIVDRAADGRAQHGRQQQRAREQAEYSGTRQVQTLCDRVRQDRRQIVA
jgi:hypothetical protein